MTEEKLDIVERLLRELGYRAERMDDRILSGMGGVKVSVLYAADDELQLNCVFFKNEDKNYDLNLINQFNYEYRFGKLFILPDGELVFTIDQIFDVSAKEAKAKMERIILQFEVLIAEMRAKDFSEISISPSL